MARPREFDTDRALQGAMLVFWKQGYHATSVQDLMKAAGIQKQSLYGAFGDKRSLFLKCLRHYSQQTLLEIQRMLNEAGSPLEGIERVMRYAAQPVNSKESPPGCLMTNTALESRLEDPAIAAEVRSMFRGLEKLLAAAVRRAQAQNEIRRNLDAAAAGQSLVNTISGIRVLEKTGASRHQVHTVVETALAAIRR